MKLLWILIPLLFSGLNFAQQSINALLNSAEALFEKGKYYGAITEYKRVQFFDEKESYRFVTNYRIGQCYKAGGKYNDAVYFFGKALPYADEESNKKEVLFELIKTNILRRTFSNAYSLINEMKRSYSDEETERELNYWYGWALMLDAKWNEARNVFLNIEEKELANLCKNVIDKEYPVTFTKLISYIVPGAGQIYTGNYLSGLMSLGWNVLWAYVTIDAFIAERVFDGVMAGNLLWFRFYRGNYYNAEKFAVEKNIEIYNNAYKFLMEKYKGKKP